MLYELPETMQVHARRLFRSERAANLVEMAVVTPLLLLMLAGIADLGRAFYTYISLTNAAREGARYAARFPFQDIADDVTEVVRRVQDEPNMPGVSWDAVAVTVVWSVVDDDTQRPVSGTPVTVEASLELDTLLGSVLGLPSLPVRTQAVMIVYGIDGATPQG